MNAGTERDGHQIQKYERAGPGAGPTRSNCVSPHEHFRL
jgi:hypothetical protein